MSVISEAERLRRRRLRLRIALLVIGVLTAVFSLNNLGLIRDRAMTAASALLPLASASASKARRAARDDGEAEDGLSALETRAGLTAKGVMRGDGARATRYPHRDVLCLARVVYHDGREFGQSARAAMAQVALNRLSTFDFGASICEVVYRGMGRQFGCMFRETCREVGSVPRDTARWSEALATAVRVLKGEIDTKAVGEATHFHKAGTKPRWLRRVTRAGEVDGLVLSVEKRTLGPAPAAAPDATRAVGASTVKARTHPRAVAGAKRPATAGPDRSARSALGGPMPPPARRPVRP